MNGRAGQRDQIGWLTTVERQVHNLLPVDNVGDSHGDRLDLRRVSLNLVLR